MECNQSPSNKEEQKQEDANRDPKIIEDLTKTVTQTPPSSTFRLTPPAASVIPVTESILKKLNSRSENENENGTNKEVFLFSSTPKINQKNGAKQGSSFLSTNRGKRKIEIPSHSITPARESVQDNPNQNPFNRSKKCKMPSSTDKEDENRDIPEYLLDLYKNRYKESSMGPFSITIEKVTPREGNITNNNNYNTGVLNLASALNRIKEISSYMGNAYDFNRSGRNRFNLFPNQEINILKTFLKIFQKHLKKRF